MDAEDPGTDLARDDRPDERQQQQQQGQGGQHTAQQPAELKSHLSRLGLGQGAPMEDTQVQHCCHATVVAFMAVIP